MLCNSFFYVSQLNLAINHLEPVVSRHFSTAEKIKRFRLPIPMDFTIFHRRMVKGIRIKNIPVRKASENMNANYADRVRLFKYYLYVFSPNWLHQMNY